LDLFINGRLEKNRLEVDLIVLKLKIAVVGKGEIFGEEFLL